MKKNLVYALLVAAVGCSYANAEEQKDTSGETKVKIEDAKEKNKVDGDVDTEITNAKLRAESGSKSKYSLSFTAGYSGGSLEEPMSKNRANPTNEPLPQRTSLGGSFGGRYRIDKNQSLSVGIGYSVQRPFHEAKYGDVSDPYLSYSNAGKIGEVQNIAEANIWAATNSDELDVGTVGGIGLGNTMMYDFGGSKLSLGLALDASYTYFSKDKDDVVILKGEPPRRTGRYQQDYQFGAYPLVEYAVSDKLQLRTVFRPWIFGHNVFQEGFTFTRRPWTQSIGVGYAVARDIYLYPNFQYDWEQWRANDFNWFDKDVRENTTVGLNATLNIF